MKSTDCRDPKESVPQVRYRILASRDELVTKQAGGFHPPKEVVQVIAGELPLERFGDGRLWERSNQC